VRVLWRALRDRGRTRAWLAAETGISLATLDGWRSGHRVPRLPALERCFDALQMDVIAVPRAQAPRRTIHHPKQEGLPL
jgi:hypothetical protein